MAETKEMSFHDKQYQAFNFKTQFGAAICGSQSGKTLMGAYWAANEIGKEMQRDKPRPGLIGAPTYKVLQQSTLAKFFEEFPQYRKYYKKQENVIEVPYTNKDGVNDVYLIFIRSFDRPLGVEGMSPGWAWLDEFGQCDLMAWTVVKTRMTVTKGRILITTTPYNMGFLYQNVFLPWKNKEDPRISVFTWKSIDNPYADAEHIEAERKLLPTEEFRRRYEGEFTRMTGLVYRLDDSNYLKRDKLPFKKVIGGIDWGWNRAAISVIGITDTGYHIIDEWYEANKTTAEILDATRDLQETHKVSRWYADSANPEKIEEANRGTGLYVVGYKKKRDSVTAGISHIKQLIQEHRLFIFDDLISHIAEFESYHYSDQPRPGKEDDPVKENDHLMDAMRYSILGDGPAGRFQPSKKGWKKKSLLSLDKLPVRGKIKYIFN